MQHGSALVHGKHVGASAHIGACITGLDAPDGQDAIEVHGSWRQLPIMKASPYQCVGWRLGEAERINGIHETSDLLYIICPLNLDPVPKKRCCLPLTLLLAVQMKVTSAPARTLWLVCSSTVTVMALVGASVHIGGELQ